MAGEIALSIEETNKLRIQLGLKPIVEEPKKKDEVKESGNENISEDNELHFISKDKVSMLRNKLDKMNEKLYQASIMTESNNNAAAAAASADNNNWLDAVREKKPNTNRVKLNRYLEDEEEEEEEDDLPIMQVSHDISNLSKGKSTILTLKETSIGNEGEDEDDNDDILEDEDVVVEEVTAKNLKLKTLNKDRRRKKMKLDVTSKDIEQTEEEGSNSTTKPTQNTIVVGGEIQTNETIEKSAVESQSNLNLEGRIRVAFDNDSDEDDDDDDENGMTDYKPVKIKKRKRKEKEHVSSRKRNTIRLPTQIHSVNLDDDEGEDENDDDNIIIPQRKHTFKDVDADGKDNDDDDIAMIIRRETIEKERLRSLNKIQSVKTHGLTIDETTTFFDSLNSPILTETRGVDVEIPPVADSKIEDAPEDNTTSVTPVPKPKVDFYNGLASTLNFLKDHDILPKKEDIPHPQSPSNTTDSRDQMGGDNNDGDINLETYNPTINLEYKDAQGNKLTTKEAYKKLSQKFHGTKSNKKKQLKFNQRVKDRNRLNK